MPRKKKKKYKTGIHRSPKCKTLIEYRSGWEKEVCVYLDSLEEVLEYGYECVQIPYLSNTRTGKIRTYYPDFLITYKDGTRKLVEVKRKDKLGDQKVLKKAAAAEQWAKQNNIKYEFWTNLTIAAIKRINEAKNPTKTTKKPSRKARKPPATKGKGKRVSKKVKAPPKGK